MHHHVEALGSLETSRCEEWDLVQVFDNEIVFFAVFLDVAVHAEVEQKFVADADRANSIDEFFVRETLDAVRKECDFVIAFIQPLKNLVMVKFCATRFRIFDVSPVNR